VVVGDVMKLCLSLEFGKVEVFTTGARPTCCENAGVCPCRLSIKLDRQWENRNEGVGV